MNQSLIHDMTFITAREVMKTLQVSREGEYRWLWGMVYGVIRAGLECYEIKAERRLSRSYPSSN